MKIYLVRHGKSQFNAENRHQHKDVPLLDVGMQQAEFLAQRLNDLGIDMVVSSPYRRTQETAEVIKRTLQKPLQFSDLFVEVRVPAVMVGKQTSDEEVLSINQQLIEHLGDGDWRYADEETFAEIKKRGEDALEYLNSLSVAKVLVVSHARMIRVLVGLMMFGKEMSARDYKKMWFTVMDNTGITVCEFNEKRAMEERWKLLSWNDVSHLT